MRIKKYILAVLLVVLIGVGAFIHLASNLVGGGGLNIQLPEEIVSGETTNFLVVASVWGGGGSIEGRYTDLSLGYRLNSDGEYSVLFPELAELPDNYKRAMTEPGGKNQYEAYSFTIPAFPSGISGQLEYYIDSTLDGYKNHSTGTRPIVAKPATQATNSTIDLTQTYQNEEMGFEVMYPADWGIETIGDYESKKSNRVLFYTANDQDQAVLTFEMQYGVLTEGQSIETWYQNRFPGTIIESGMRTVIDHEPALLVDTGSSYVLYTKVRLKDVLLVSFPKQPLYQKVVASLRLNVTNFGIVSFTQDDTASWETAWRITLPNIETQSGRFQIRSVLSRVYEQTSDMPEKELPLDQSIPDEFLSSVLVTPDQIQKRSGDPVTFSFMLNYRDLLPNPEGPQTYVYIKPAFGFTRHYAKDTVSGHEVSPFATNGSVPILGSSITSVEFNKTGKLVDGQLVLATIKTTGAYRYTIFLEEISSPE